MENNPSLANTAGDQLDNDCFICLDIMCEPAKTPCGHYLCLSCLSNVLALKRKCPFCRADIFESFRPKVDKPRQRQIMKLRPEQFTKRMQEIRKMRQACDQIVISYGNDHEIVSSESSHNHHSWTAFVRLQDAKLDINNFIKKVVFKLHPTFHRPIREVNKAPFEVGCLGWGIFLIPITIYWQDWLEKEPTKMNHYLSFNGAGESHTDLIKFNKPVLKSLDNIDSGDEI